MSGGGAQSPRGNETIDFASIVRLLWTRRWQIVAVGGIGLVLAIVAYFLATPVYTAQVSLLPRGSSTNAGLAGQVATLTGLQLPSGATDFEQYYGKILLSDRVVGAIIDSKWSTGDGSAEYSLYEVFGIDAEDEVNGSARARARLTRVLREEAISFYREKLSGFMIVRVSVPEHPDLAAALANFAVAKLEQFNNEYALGKAAEKREFLEARIVAVNEQLQAASSTLTAYISTNRAFQASPELLQEYEALQREVQAQTSIWIELRKQLELAKMEEAHEQQTLVVLDEATPPLKPSSPNVVVFVVFGLVLGAALAVVWLFVLGSVLRAIRSPHPATQADGR